MKEFEGKPINLTTEHQTPYSNGEPRFNRGGIFMEGNQDMAPQNSQPANPEQKESPPAQKSGSVIDQARNLREAVTLHSKNIAERQSRGEKIDPEELQTLRVMRSISGGADALSTDNIENPIIKEALEVINATRHANLPLEGVLERKVEDIVKAKDAKPEERQLALDRIRQLSEDLTKAERTQQEEARSGRLGIHDDQIKDPLLRGHVQSVNVLIDEIKRGKLDDVRYDALRKEIRELEAPYEKILGDPNDPKVKEQIRQREARLRQFDSDRESLIGAMTDARRSLMRASQGGAEKEKMDSIVSELMDAIEKGDNNAYDIIDDKIKNSGFNPGDQRGYYSEIITEAAERADAAGGKDYMIEYLLEFGLERILSRADQNTSDPYPQFNLYESYNIDNIIQAARRYDENAARRGGNKRELFNYLTNLQYKRQAMHQLFQGMKDRQTYVQLVTQLLRRNGLDFVEHRIAGVSDVQIIYEQVLGSKLSLKKKGWLDHQDFNDADQEVKDILNKYKELKDREELRKEYVEDGDVKSRPLRDWEITRAWTMGRSLNTATERRITYGVLGDLPNTTDERLRSLEFEFIARTLAPLKLVPEKFFDYPVAKRYFELLYEELRAKKEDGVRVKGLDYNRYGYVVKDKDGKNLERGLYGKTQKAFAILDTGIPDLKSNSWRGRLLLLKNPNYKTATDEHGTSYTIMEYLDLIKREVKEKYEAIVKEKYPNTKKSDLELENILDGDKYPYKDLIKKGFNTRVAEVVRKQRLFLGALAKNAGDLGESDIEIGTGPDGKPKYLNLKEVIWENVATLLPSRIAAFLPYETLDIFLPRVAAKERVKQQIKQEKPGITEDQLNSLMKDEEIKARINQAVSETKERVKQQIKQEKPGITEDQLNKEAESRIIKDIKGDDPEKYREKALEEWEPLRNKLWSAERARVKRDAIVLKVGGDRQTKDLDYFLDKEGLDEVERTLIGKLTELGKKHAKDFSSIAFPFTPFLDDVPETAWNNLEDNDLDRLLVRDHSEYEKGYQAITKLIANPSAKPEEVVKAFEEAFHGIASPLGIKDTQKKIEPFVSAYVRISRLNNWAKYFGTIMKWGRRPRSEAERFNLQSQIAIDEENQGRVLDVLAQHEVLNDDPTEADKHGKTQLARVKKELKLDLLAMILMHFRIFAMLFGPVFALELFKSILPPDMVKVLG